jgi:hypothetical protein
MAGRGPAPKDPAQRRRRNKTSTRMALPAEGRKGRAPKWPLMLAEGRDEDASKLLRKLEAALWRDLWKLPQAVAWERLGYTREVALYVRHQVSAELGSLDHAREARMRSDRLGLTPTALRSLQWEIVADELAERRETKTSDRPRLRAVDPAASDG